MIKLKDILNESLSKIFDSSTVSKIQNSIEKITGAKVEYD